MSFCTIRATAPRLGGQDRTGLRDWPGPPGRLVAGGEVLGERVRDAWASDWKPLTPPLLPEIERSDQVPVHSSWYAQSSYVMWSATVQAGTFAAARARIMSSSSWEPGAAAFDGVVGAGVVGCP